VSKEEAKTIAERICDEMWGEYGMCWMEDDAGTPQERLSWVDKISAALVRASGGEPPSRLEPPT
jgi:hypothetical protein